MTHKHEPPVTPEELRDIATLIDPTNKLIYSTAAWQLNARKLRQQADWLELHMPLYREAVDLLGDARHVSEQRGFLWEERKRTLLAKVKGE